MNKLLIPAAAILLTAGSSVAAPVSFSDNFDGGLQGTYSTKWTADQPGLWGYSGSDTAILQGDAKSQYRTVNAQAFSIASGETATISTQLRYEFAGGGTAGTTVNKDFFGLLLTDSPNWWDGSGVSTKERGLMYRGDALGFGTGGAPEGWITQNNLGVNVNSASPVVSEWTTLEWNLYTDGSDNIVGTMTFTWDTGSFTTIEQDTGYDAGATLYSGYSSVWQNTGTNIATYAKMNYVEMDNFSVDVVPEPATLGLIGAFGGALVFIRRRFMI